MKIIFISNFFNHHQKEVADELYRLTDGGYRFFSTGKMPKDRKALGWGIDQPDYVVEVGTQIDAERQKEIDEADVVIYSVGPYEWIKDRLRRGALTFFYTERLLKTKARFLRWIKSVLTRTPKWRKKKAYLLCAGGFVAADFKRCGCFADRAYRWGYFPAFYEQNKDWQDKKKNSIVWCARFIGWKHPEAMLTVAKRLKADGYDFTVRMIGQGELLEDYRKKVEEEGLQDVVTLTGGIPFENVRDEMCDSQIFCFTSDGEEGWGAVLNESMNAGMAVVSSHAIGATPFLVEDDVNGLVYESGNVDDLYEKVKSLLDDEALAARLGAAAYRTIKEEWNGKVAAKRLMTFIENLQSGKDTPFESGPCSKAPILQDNWYKA